jgi:hypothetical protein
VWSLVLLSLALTATTFFPHLSTATIEGALAVGAVIGVGGGAVAIIEGRRSGHRREPDLVASLTRAERRVLRQQDRLNWQTPDLAFLARPAISPIRRAGLLTLRGYLAVAVVFVVIKIVQAGVA